MDFAIYVDADSVPQNIRNIILRAAVRLGAAAFFVADRPLKDVLQFIADDTHRLRTEKSAEVAGKDALRSIRSKISSVVVETGDGSADNRIVECAAENLAKNPGLTVLCITHDIPLASRLLDIGCAVIDDRGGEYTPDNIKTRLMDRSVNAELREMGIFSDVRKKQKQADVKAFSDTLDKVSARLKKEKVPCKADSRCY